jgi:hypothetical protein
MTCHQRATGFAVRRSFAEAANRSRGLLGEQRDITGGNRVQLKDGA